MPKNGNTGCPWQVRRACADTWPRAGPTVNTLGHVFLHCFQSCLRTPGGAGTVIASHAGAVAYQGEGAAGSAGVSFVAFDAGLGDFCRFAEFRAGCRFWLLQDLHLGVLAACRTVSDGSLIAFSQAFCCFPGWLGAGSRGAAGSLTALCPGSGS